MAALTSHPMFHDPAYPSSEVQTPEQVALVRELNDRLERGELALADLDCLCGGRDHDLVATYDRYRIRQPVVICRRCGLMRCQPRMADETLAWFYGSDLYRQLYDNRSILPHTPEKFRDAVKRRAFRVEVIRALMAGAPLASVAEIGCGAGWNLHAFHGEGVRVVGCDYSPDLTAAGRAMGMDIRTGPRQVLGGGTYDLVILSHVLEHMPDPVAEVAAIAQLMAEGGHFYIEVPDAADFCLGALQSAHLWYFTPDLLIDAVAKAGLVPVAQRQLGPHFGVLFKKGEPGPARASGEYGRLCGIIRGHERRQRLKDGLESLGLLGLARRLARLLRG